MQHLRGVAALLLLDVLLHGDPLGLMEETGEVGAAEADGRGNVAHLQVFAQVFLDILLAGVHIFTQYPDILSINDLRSALGIGRTKAYELVSSGELPSIRVGNAIRIPKTSLLDYVKGSGYNVDNADERRYHEGGKQ